MDAGGGDQRRGQARDGGRATARAPSRWSVGVFDSYARGGDELHFPLPWADGPEASFVVSAGELRSIFEAAGFEVVVWNEQEGALAEISQRSFTPTVDPTRVGLARLMPDFDHRMGNVGRNIAEGRLGLLQAVLRAV